MTQPTFNRLIELEGGGFGTSFVSQGCLFSNGIKSWHTVLSCPILSNHSSVTILTIAHFCPFSCFLKSQRHNKENPMLKVIESFLQGYCKDSLCVCVCFPTASVPVVLLSLEPHWRVQSVSQSQSLVWSQIFYYFTQRDFVNWKQRSHSVFQLDYIA